MFFLAAVLVITVSSGCSSNPSTPAPPTTLNLTEADAGKTVTIADKGEVTITLAGNATTGYAWTLLSGNESVLSSGGEPVYTAPQSMLVGAAGTFTFKFQAVAVGTVVLKLGSRAGEYVYGDD
jgi:predicted secreted protein